MANPADNVILNAVKNQLGSPLVRAQAPLLTIDIQVWRLILHCVQNDKAERACYSLAVADFAVLLRNVSS